MRPAREGRENTLETVHRGVRDYGFNEARP